MLLTLLLTSLLSSASAQKGKVQNINGASPKVFPLDCSGVRVCGVLSLRTTFGKGINTQTQPSVQGLWPQTGENGNSQCLPPQDPSNTTTQIWPCFRRQDVVPGVLVGVENTEWNVHGKCAGVRDINDYFTQICNISQAPLALMNGLQDPRQMITMLNMSGFEVFRTLPDATIQLPACRRESDGQWVLSRTSEFAKNCNSAPTNASSAASSSAPTSRAAAGNAAAAAAAAAATAAAANAAQNPTNRARQNTNQQPSPQPTNQQNQQNQQNQARSVTNVAVTTVTTTTASSTTGTRAPTYAPPTYAPTYSQQQQQQQQPVFLNQQQQQQQTTTTNRGYLVTTITTVATTVTTVVPNITNYTQLAAQLLPACALKNTCLYIVQFPAGRNVSETCGGCSFFIDAMQRCLSLDRTCQITAALQTLRTCCQAGGVGASCPALQNASSVGDLSAAPLAGPLLATTQQPFPTFQAAGITPGAFPGNTNNNFIPILAPAPVPSSFGAAGFAAPVYPDTFAAANGGAAALPVFNQPLSTAPVYPAGTQLFFPATNTFAQSAQFTSTGF